MQSRRREALPRWRRVRSLRRGQERRLNRAAQPLRNRKHCPKASPIGVLCTTCSQAYCTRHAGALLRLAEQPRGFAGSFAWTAEIQNRFALNPKNLAVLVRIFRQHTATHGCNLETPHHMPVTIGLTD